MLNLVMPMAGRGKRFEMYDKPKLLVDVNGKPMMQAVLENIKEGIGDRDIRPIYIFNKKMDGKYGLSDLATSILTGYILRLDDFTEGAACTVLAAKEFINSGDPLMTANVDQIVDSPWLGKYIDRCFKTLTDGVILTYQSNEPYHSFVEVSGSGFVTRAAEKKPISNHATVGIYHWSQGQNFVTDAEDMIKRNIRYKDEFYLCPVYNQGIERARGFFIYEIPKEAVHIIGTPETLNAYAGYH
jgi:dTDP-glucose pyrophosphorylase